MRVGGIEEDFVRLEYAGGDKLMVPMYHLSQLQEYRGSSEHVRLDKLGGMRWEKTKRKVKDAVLQIAHELLQVQAYRQSQKGFSMAGPDHHFKTFEAAFPFEETLDQLKAIEACILDLSKETPMDRVVCGDVGFGKTEVAIRAAYLAVLNGYQVAILVPTTVLAEQHGKTFSERLEPFGVTVEVLNRFRTKKKANQILERAREAKLDILVGTHRLLSADVHYKNLGLLIVDEEHRFGVKHKERVKQIRQKINVLTLTATPIPRTLYMATSGVRDLSVIQTPPVDRLDVQTYVLRFEEQLIKDAIDKELSRGGQVFFLHNRVESIESMVGLLQELVQDARIGVGHGQMSGSALENVMVQFVRHDLDILVCTTIIESGIDIPRANTIFVHRADHFGLSQLHQIRGRIGRSSIRGFAYFLLPRDEQVNPDAMDRLMVLKRYSELGSGYNISLQDLELRGAGDLLGKNQSGHIAAVGFELYMELLKQAVEQAQGRESTLAIEPELKIPFPAFLPESYIEQPSHRFEWYQRFSSEVSPEGIECLRNDLKQLHGPLPSEAENVVSTMKLRLHLKRLGCSALSVAFDDSEFRLGLSFVPESPIDRIKLSTLLHERAPCWTLTSTGKLAIREPWVRKTQIKPLELIIDLVSALPTHRGFRS